MTRRWAATFLCLALSQNAMAQSRAAPDTKTAPQPASEAPPPPYEPQLLHLAEIMGALAYLRDLCGMKDGESWRARMSALMEAEAATDLRRERLAGSFNRGFYGYQATYRVCTANAEIIIARALEEGERLAKDVAARYSGG